MGSLRTSGATASTLRPPTPMLLLWHIIHVLVLIAVLLWVFFAFSPKHLELLLLLQCLFPKPSSSSLFPISLLEEARGMGFSSAPSERMTRAHSLLVLLLSVTEARGSKELIRAIGRSQPAPPILKRSCASQEKDRRKIKSVHAPFPCLSCKCL